MALHGFIKLHRKLIEWGWYSDCVVKDVFLHILMTANFEDGQYMGYEIKAGQAIIGRKMMSKELGFSEQQIRTALKKLESTKEISLFSTNRFTIATVENWAFYQCGDVDSNQQSTNNQPTDNQQSTNNQPHCKNDKKYKNDKNDKKIYPYAEIVDYLNEMIGAHYKASTEETRKHIRARIDEGFTVEDFKTVIYKKAKQWKDDREMCKYLRPQTLFSTKFEGYLNEKEGMSIEERVMMA